MKKVVLSAVLAFAGTLVAEMKVGTVNMVDLVKLHPTHESNRALVKSTDKDYKAKLDAQQDALKTIADEGKKLQEDLVNPMLSAAAKAEAQKKIESIQQRFLAAQQDLRAAAQHYQTELADLETRLLKLETDDIRAKISAYAKENGYDLIVDATMLAYSNASFDVTDDILRAMKVDPAKRTASGETKGEAK